MYMCESPTQCYVFLYTAFGRTLDDLARLKYLGYDRICDLHPFLKNLTKKGSMGVKILLENVKFMVDLWHYNKHKEATCMPPNIPNASTTHIFQHFQKSMVLTQNVLSKPSSGLANSSLYPDG